jgi:hypothetical protein
LIERKSASGGHADTSRQQSPFAFQTGARGYMDKDPRPRFGFYLEGALVAVMNAAGTVSGFVAFFHLIVGK